MPEYLAPGVYVEEVSFRAKSIEGVPTSTTGYAGMTRYGPVTYLDGTQWGPSTNEPRLITSFTEYERVYGGLGLTGNLKHGPNDGAAVERLDYMAHAVRAFFLNGGQRVYVSRVFVPRDGATPDWGIAKLSFPVGATTAVWKARWPGYAGNVFVEAKPVRTKNVAFTYTTAPKSTWGVQAKSAKAGSIVEVYAAGATLPKDTDPLGALYVVQQDAEGRQTFHQAAGPPAALAADSQILLVSLTVNVSVDADRLDSYTGLATDDDPGQVTFVAKILQKDNPADENAVVWLDYNPAAAGSFAARLLMQALVSNSGRLTGGHDGVLAAPSDLAGKDADPDDAKKKATGLAALGEIDDIAIVAVPDSGGYDDFDTCVQAAETVIDHAELMRYRIAVVDPPKSSSLTAVRHFRGRFDSKYAAVYHPWVEIFDPLQRPAQGAPPRRILLPPSGFVTGIYARSDITRGVFKAPANEVVRGLTKFEMNINKGRQSVLNPEGINSLRFFEGRGNRVWGARTMSSDPEWKYVNVRRLFIYLEHSIDKATQWAVFEPNNMRLWANITQMVEDFLLVQWRDGALMGAKPEEAYFVRCDRTTMTQNDLDNGRLICLIGVAPTKPAEFVIFRIGQWTAESKAA
jgi:phage tail sheath protein FI